VAEVPLHFIVPHSFADVVEEVPGMRLGENYPYWLGGRFNWAAQSWLVLREFRENVTIGTEPVPGRINVAHVMTWRTLGPRRGEFRLSIRADYPRLYDVDFEVLQNPAVDPGRHAVYLPYWPVPGLIPRAPGRRGVKTIAYAGRIGPLNLAEGLQASGTGPLAGFDFRVIPPDRWHDLSEIDVLVAIRTLDQSTHAAKPPSKLFSAWRAGIPLIAGWDSAFSHIGEPGVDYVRVASETEFTEALNRLASDPAYYDSLVRAGSAKAPEVGHEAIARVWLDAFDGPVRDAFERWKKNGPTARAAILGRATDRLRNAASAARSSLRARAAMG
jgi:hypothetical protein